MAAGLTCNCSFGHAVVVRGAPLTSHMLHALLPPLLPRSPQGLGKALVEGMTRTLLRRDITNITLFADAHGKRQGLRLFTQCTCHACRHIP